MANIPGLTGYNQPGAFSRDRIISRGASIPGGLRVIAMLGEGAREEVIVASAVGGGADGSASCSPTGSGDGRFFSLKNAPVVSGRTELRLNGTLLFGFESEIDNAGFDGAFDYRIDPQTGCIELQGASIGDQNGKGYSSSSLNIGNGVIFENHDCDPISTLSVLDSSTPAERWTMRCVSVVRDSNGDPIPGLATFSATGSVSGQIYNSNGSPALFHSSHFGGSKGAISGNKDLNVDGYAGGDGYIVASSLTFGFGDAIAQTQFDTLTDTFVISGADLVSDGQSLVGDFLCVNGTDAIEITDISYDGYLEETTVTVKTSSITVDTGYDWSIKATNLFIDALPQNNFKSSDVGKVLSVCPGGLFTGGYYVIEAVTSSNTVRVHSLEDSSVAFPPLSGELSAEDLTFNMVETNGILILGIKEGSIPFEVNDRFFVDVKSRALSKGDSLQSVYIHELDVSDPEFFVSANDLFVKHGTPSETNTLSLGAQMAFENGAAGILAVQCKPAVQRRTVETLLTQKNSRGVGGFVTCSPIEDCGSDDFMFTIPRPTTGLRNGRPDSNSRVNVFVVRGGKDIQIFPNKYEFYNSQLQTVVQTNAWIADPDNAYAYTVVNTPSDVVGTGVDGAISAHPTDASLAIFTSSEVNFDAKNIGDTIVISSMKALDDSLFTSITEISDALFVTAALESNVLVISEIISDTEVVVSCGANGITTYDFNPDDFVAVEFTLNAVSSSSTDAALLLHKTLYTSGTIKEGDGIKISYVDENDAAFFDTNWFEALEALEAVEAQIVVPLPSQAISSIFRATVNHCENMSSIANRKERLTFIGAQKGLTVAALLGTTQVAIEDIGILEGIQGDDVQEVLDGNIEDLANYKLSDNYNSERCVFFYPESIVRNVAGTNVALHGFYMAAAAAGYMSARQNVAIPLTYKTLSGFTLTRDKIYRQTILNSLGEVGATVIQPISGGGQVLAGRTTSQSGYIEDEEISIVFIRDAVKKTLRNSLKSYIGGVQTPDITNLVSARVNTIMSGLLAQGLITDYGNIRVEQDKVDLRQINVFLRFVPSYPINFVFIDLEVGVS